MLASGDSEVVLPTPEFATGLMTRKIIIDCDPGIDDAVAIYMSPLDPRLEILAITANAAAVEAAQLSRRSLQQLKQRLSEAFVTQGSRAKRTGNCSRSNRTTRTPLPRSNSAVNV